MVKHFSPEQLMPEPTRRDALTAATALAASGRTHARDRDAGRIKAENDKPGTTDWQLTYVKFDAKAKYRQSIIEGYCTRTSVAAGETDRLLRQHRPREPLHHRPLSPRLLRRRGRAAHADASGRSTGRSQPTPPVGEKRLREVPWEPCGIDRGAEGLAERRLPRPSSRPRRAATRATASSSSATTAPPTSSSSARTNTWQAYNKWPENHSLYDNDRPDKRPLVSGVRVSFDRPYAQVPAGH